MIEKDRLQETYNQLLPLMGENPESFEAILQVEAHRQFWRPKQPKVVLLAESHVYTSHHELNTMWGYQPEIAGIPKTYVRLVYCLGYGENNFVGWPVDGNRGTPQFWKIFYSCIQGPDIGFAPVLKSRT